MTEPRPNLATLIDTMERSWAHDVAVVEHRGVRRYATTYGALAMLARRFAAGLAQRDIVRGDRVLIWGANSAEWVAAYFGCVLRGVLPVPLDAAGDPAFANRVFSEVAPRLVVGDKDLLASLVESTTPRLALHGLHGSLPAEGATALADLSEADPLQILFTSGTTGEPKGVVHTHGNLLASITPIEKEMGKYRRYERWFHPLRFLHTLPLSHVFGQFMGLWVPPLLGACVHYESRTTATRLLDLIPAEKINVLAAVPRTLGLLRTHLLTENPRLAGEVQAASAEPIHRRWWRFRALHRRLGLRFWAAVCGGATLAAEVETFWTTMGFALVQGYGLTETAALVTLNHPFRTARGSIGAPLPGRSVRVNAAGELEVQGAMVSRASWQGGRMVERADPWLATGDLAQLGEDGRVQLLGRTGQRIVTAAGLNVYLQDVEDALAAESEIDEALVYARTAPDGGDEPAAVVVSRAAGAVLHAAVEHANSALAPHQRVRRWSLWPGLQLPRTSTGKVKRAAIEAWAHQNDAATPAVPKAGAGDAAMLLLQQVTGRAEHEGARTDDSARLDEDWSLDSMGRVALASALEEQLGVVMDDGRVDGLRTLGELRALVVSAKQTGPHSTGPRPVPGTDTVTETPAIPAPTTEGAVEPHAPMHPVERVPMRYPRWPRSRPVRLVRMLFQELVARPLTWILAAPRVFSFGTAATSQSMLLISNHRTAMDVPLLLYALPFRLRSRTVVAVSGEMLAGWERSWRRAPLPAEYAVHRRWWGPIASFLLRALYGVFPLPSSAGFRRSFAHAGDALDHGFHVLVFPEGRRNKDTALQPFRQGIGILWSEAESSVLPLALSTSSRFQFRSRPVVRVGEPIPAGAAGSTPEQRARHLEQAVLQMLRQR